MTTSYTDTAPPDGSDVDYEAIALNPGGESPPTQTLSIQTPVAPPANLSAEATSDSEIDLTWDNVSTVADQFIVERSDNGGGTYSEIARPTDPQFQDTALDPDKQYVYTVRSTVDGLNTSFDSNTASATTDPALPDFHISGPGSVGRGGNYQLAINAQFPPNSPEADGITQMTIDWGDGSTPDTYSDASSPQNHVYDTRGHFTISATATCTAGTVDANMTVTVGTSDVQMELSPSPISVTEGDEAGFTARITGDTAGLKVLEWVVDWDDGGGPQIVSTSDSGLSQSFSNTYGNGGTTFDAAVTAFTDQGPICADEYINVAVTPNDPNHPSNPPATVQNPQGPGGDPNGNGTGGGGDGGSVHTFWFNWCTPNPDGYTFLLDWGDGSAPIQVSTPSGSGRTNETHGYGHGGQYWVTVTDDNGNTSAEGGSVIPRRRDPALIKCRINS